MKTKNTSENNGRAVIESLISGSTSSAFTTTIFQPLELLKTKIQIHGHQADSSPYRILGRTTHSAGRIIRDHGILYLWRGTGASLFRSIPGVGLYYACLHSLQVNLSSQSHKPDSPAQAFYFGLTARSLVSFLLLPATVVKVRYESGQYKYPSLPIALRDAYLKNGWVGAVPTILRDSLFSGVYYMCYTKLKSLDINSSDIPEGTDIEKPRHSLNFFYGMLSGLIASVLTNPIDVLKTNIQVDSFHRNRSLRHAVLTTLRKDNGLLRFFDGLVPRCIRRTLIATTTWTFYEIFTDSFRRARNG